MVDFTFEGSPSNSVSECEIKLSVLIVIVWVFEVCSPNLDQCCGYRECCTAHRRAAAWTMGESRMWAFMLDESGYKLLVFQPQTLRRRSSSLTCT